MEWSWPLRRLTRKLHIEDLFWGMPFITIALYPIFLFIFYKIVRRMVADPLVDTAREANLVANLAFDEFKPDLKRGDEIGELNRALSEMADTLHARWDSERDLEDKRQQFVSAASHDLKTPLALIGGYAEPSRRTFRRRKTRGILPLSSRRPTG